jgi:hypothetical protein
MHAGLTRCTGGHAPNVLTGVLRPHPAPEHSNASHPVQTGLPPQCQQRCEPQPPPLDLRHLSADGLPLSGGGRPAPAQLADMAANRRTPSSSATGPMTGSPRRRTSASRLPRTGGYGRALRPINCQASSRRVGDMTLRRVGDSITISNWRRLAPSAHGTAVRAVKDGLDPNQLSRAEWCVLVVFIQGGAGPATRAAQRAEGAPGWGPGWVQSIASPRPSCPVVMTARRWPGG